MRGKGLEDAAVTIERFGVLGDETKGQIKALYEQIQKPVPMGWRGFTVTSDMLPRDQFIELARTLGKDANKALMYGFSVKDRSQVADALKHIGKVRFGDSAIQQIMSLSKLSERLHENIEDIFEGIDLGYFLGALHEGIMLFDKTTESGKALRKVAELVFQPLFDKSSVLLPLIQGFFEGVIISVLQLTLWVIQARNAFNRMFPGSFFKGMNALSAGSLLGSIAVGTLVVGLGLCALALVAVALAVLTLVAIVALPFVIGAAAVYGLVKAFEAVLEKLGLITKKADSAGASIRGLAASLPGSTTGAGQSAGAALGAGVVTGIQGKLADVTKAGAALVAAADKGVTTKAEIHSPSGLMRRRAHQMGEGGELGLEDKAADIEAAGAALVPSGPGGAASLGRSGGFSVENVNIKIDAPNLRDPKDLIDEVFLSRLVVQFLMAAARSVGGPAPEPVG
jgi:hypothetical protein